MTRVALLVGLAFTRMAVRGALVGVAAVGAGAAVLVVWGLCD
jgi:hypothetical protein